MSVNHSARDNAGQERSEYAPPAATGDAPPFIPADADRAPAYVYRDLVDQVAAGARLLEHALPTLRRCIRLSGQLPLSEIAELAQRALRLNDAAAQLLRELEDAAADWAASAELHGLEIRVEDVLSAGGGS